ncbi:MAG: hypothetical protein ACJ8E6_09245 [Sphingomicrobium sp.]
MTISSRLVALAAFATLGLSIGNAAHAETTVPVQSQGGDACTVTSGAFAGAKGHYKNVDGHLYCAGPGLFVPCDFNSCKSASLIRPLSALPLIPKSYVFTR